jgi:hypothetical protein
VDPTEEPFVDVHFLDGFGCLDGGAVVFDARDPVTDLWHRCAWVFRHSDGRVTEIFANNQIVPPPTLKTIVLAPLQSATPELANVLKSEFGWLNPASDILRMLNESRPINVVEHVKPQYVVQFTTKLDSLGLAYTVVDEQ